MFNLGAFEIIVLCFLGLLIFGRRLPEVGRNLGKSIVEFKKGLSGVDEEARRISEASRATPTSTPAQPGQLTDQSGAQHNSTQTISNPQSSNTPSSL